MALLEKYNVPIAHGKVAKTPKEALKIAEAIFKSKNKDVVVKAQVLAGGRGKGTFEGGFSGGVQIASTPMEVEQFAKAMIGKKLITKQTGSSGRLCNSIYIVERLYSRKDYYLAILLDRKSEGIMIMGSRRGGMDIETVASEEPHEIITMALDHKDPSKVHLSHFFTQMGIVEIKQQQECERITRNMIKLFKEKDATLLEINPFVETSDGKMVCLDAKINFDDNADFRQLDLFTLRDSTQEDPREVRASEHKLNYIGLEGEIGCLVNGAGLAMATMDIIKLHGGAPANFLDVGGSASVEQVEQAISILSKDPSVKSILVNIFGGIMRCDIIATGIINAIKKEKIPIPLVVRLLGTNVDKAKEILAESGMDVFACDDLDDAAKKSVILSKIVQLADEADIKVAIRDKN